MGGPKRRRGATPTKRRDKTHEGRAHETQAAQEQAEKRKLSYRAYRTRRGIGWGLVALGVIVGVSHWLTHLGFFSIASSGVQDLFFGYPLAALLGIAGAIVLSRT